MNDPDDYKNISNVESPIDKTITNVIREYDPSNDKVFSSSDTVNYIDKNKNKTASYLAGSIILIFILIVAYEFYRLQIYYWDISNFQYTSDNLEILEFKNELMKAAIIDTRYAIKDLFMFLGSITTGIFAYYFASGVKK